MLTCRAGTPLLSDPDLEDSWKLDVYHVPIVTLELGTNLNASNIREGVDVYFECNIKSNPWVYKVSWRHNGKSLNSNTSAGAIVSNQSLVLQSVTRSRTGIYTCVGSNHEGDGESNPVFLDVKFLPVCKNGHQRAYGVARGEPARVLCELEANPMDIHFTWKFNNTSDAVDLPASLVAADRSRSIATYTPMTELDYGTLLCWGRNELGVQHEPCVYTISPAGKPDPLHNCSILNQTAESLHVECAEGFDGGLTQHFIMEVYDADTQTLVRNVNSSAPVFAVSGLQSGLGFDISVFAANAKGRSDPVPLHAYTLKAAEKRTASPAILNITPVLGILIGGVAFLILVAIIIVVVMRLRNSSGNDSKPRDGASAEENGHTRTADKASSVPLSKDTDESIDSQEEKNPDIIPQNSDTDYQDPDEKAFAKLNNAPNRIYASINPHIHSPSSRIYDNSGNMMNVKKPRDEVTYAELALPKQQPMYVGVPHTPGGVRRQEPTVYAQIDVSKQMPPQQQHPHPHPHHHSELLQQQPQDGNTASASLPLLHHHHLAAAYTPHPHQPTLRLLSPPGPPGPHPPMSTLGPLGPCPPDDELPACAETPLLPAPAQRESTVGLLVGQPDLAGHATVTQTPRVTATRF
ncbi:hypothetical protein R5R35_008895 [Gryllus longicercus]|uniref:Ig-like domain-containing protein n=1 Tax=Gryllus longicercus TaxID=2509291 RepID=A0AAN9VIE6_9ORTH